jgi:hypothetical protein
MFSKAPAQLNSHAPNTIHFLHLYLSTSQCFTFCETYIYQKEKQALSGNLESRKNFVTHLKMHCLPLLPQHPHARTHTHFLFSLPSSVFEMWWLKQAVKAALGFSQWPARAGPRSLQTDSAAVPHHCALQRTWEPTHATSREQKLMASSRDTYWRINIGLSYIWGYHGGTKGAEKQ